MAIDLMSAAVEAVMRRHGLFTAMIENVLVDARHGFAVLYEAAYDVIGPDPGPEHGDRGGPGSPGRDPGAVVNDLRLILLVRAADRAGEHRTARLARWDAMTARRPEGAPAVRPVNGSLVGQHGAAGDEDVGSPGRIRSAAGSPAGIPGAARAAAACTHRERTPE